MLVVIEALIRVFQAGLHPGTVLVSSGDPFEVKETPSVTIHGPTIKENPNRRVAGRFFHKDLETMTFETGAHPRQYHLDFELVVTCATERELIGFLESTARFFGNHTELTVGERGTLPVTVLSPLGSVDRVNLSNLRQATGRFRVEDYPVFEEEFKRGRLINNVELVFANP